MLKSSAWLDGDLELPSAEEMEKSIATVLKWKREHVHIESSRTYAVNTRFPRLLDPLGLPRKVMAIDS